MYGHSRSFVPHHSNEVLWRPHIHPHGHETQKGSPASAESSPPIISRLKPKSQVPSPSSVGFSMHRIALALAASASAKHYITLSKRRSFDRLFLFSIFRSKATSSRLLCPSLLRQKYRKALEIDEELQQRLLNAYEIFSLRLGIIISAPLKTLFFCKWRRFWLVRTNANSGQNDMYVFFHQWSKVIPARFAAKAIAAQKLAASNLTDNNATTGPLFQIEAQFSVQNGSLSSKHVAAFIQLLNGCFCQWKVYARHQFSRRNKLIGVTSCMRVLARVFAYRGCYRKGQSLPSVEAPAFLEAGARIDYQKTWDASAVHLRAGFFIMWAELSPPRAVTVLQHLHRPTSPSTSAMSNLDLQTIVDQVSPIIMSPLRTSPLLSISLQNPDVTQPSRISPIEQNVEGESALDADSYAAAVLMDHHQSLCNQSVAPLYQTRNFRRKAIQLPEVQGIADSSLASIGEISGDSDVSDSSGDPHSNIVLTTTLRPLSPLTQAHIRANIICPPQGNGTAAGKQQSRQTNTAATPAPKMQAFKMVKSPPINPMQGSHNVPKLHAARAGVTTDFPTVGSRAHSSFLSSAIALRIRMSQELQSKESTTQKSAPALPRHTGVFDAARQPWVRQ